ncbi:PREDICTED: phosphatidylinositol-glycan biosynthesis class X protein [Chrysochloris asiatica]|uniref:Phosphatidylinositol-glycan biosynthesis class X protein n=1 Tax=Chrysochloris asiatica TaxID=185453 RepID=A0A9B0TSX9_CHRAS|nr:PREDICTED: phosphatidylinositol-glycan biosynthesis class X protein [Chrysochloris asiatica]
MKLKKITSSGEPEYDLEYIQLIFKEHLKKRRWLQSYTRDCKTNSLAGDPKAQIPGSGDQGPKRPELAPRQLVPVLAQTFPQQQPRASFYPHFILHAPYGHPPSGVLAALAVVIRAAAWLLLWVATGLTCTPAAAFTDRPFNVGIRATCSEIILRLEVLKDGFHRDLLVKVKFGESIENLQTCKLLIKQYIPTGLFVDPYELASLREKNITEAVMVSENFNIEAPNYLSKESEILIYARQDSQCIDCFRAFLPVHYRYHRPHSKEGETFIVVNNPDLLMYCDQEFPVLKCWAQSEVAAPCSLKNNDICQWKNMKYKSVFKNVTLQVPVGLTIHTSLVCFVTLLITILCSTLILVAVFKYGHFSL